LAHQIHHNSGTETRRVLIRLSDGDSNPTEGLMAQAMLPTIS